MGMSLHLRQPSIIHINIHTQQNLPTPVIRSVVHTSRWSTHPPTHLEGSSVPIVIETRGGESQGGPFQKHRDRSIGARQDRRLRGDRLIVLLPQ